MAGKTLHTNQRSGRVSAKLRQINFDRALMFHLRGKTIKLQFILGAFIQLVFELVSYKLHVGADSRNVLQVLHKHFQQPTISALHEMVEWLLAILHACLKLALG